MGEVLKFIYMGIKTAKMGKRKKGNEKRA